MQFVRVEPVRSWGFECRWQPREARSPRTQGRTHALSDDARANDDEFDGNASQNLVLDALASLASHLKPLIMSILGIVHPFQHTADQSEHPGIHIRSPTSFREFIFTLPAFSDAM